MLAVSCLDLLLLPWFSLVSRWALSSRIPELLPHI